MSACVMALDTGGHACSVAIVDGSGTPLFNETLSMSRGHAAAFAPMCARALDQVAPDQIGSLIVTRGPGGFTGMRAGLAYARAFALARGISCIGLTTFEALRLSVGPEVLCLVDTRRGDFFADETTARALGNSEQAIWPLPAAPFLSQPLAGSIWHSDALKDQPNRPTTPGWVEPCPLAMAREGLRRREADLVIESSDLSPLYVREPAIG